MCCILAHCRCVLNGTVRRRQAELLAGFLISKESFSKDMSIDCLSPLWMLADPNAETCLKLWPSGMQYGIPVYSPSWPLDAHC